MQADAYLAACDVPGIQRMIPVAWRRWSLFDNLYKLEAVPVATVQLRYDGWVTELGDSPLNEAARRDLARPAGLDNLLYTADADFSCFADLALASPEDYRKEGQGSLLQGASQGAEVGQHTVVGFKPSLAPLHRASNERGDASFALVQIGRAHV